MAKVRAAYKSEAPLKRVSLGSVSKPVPGPKPSPKARATDSLRRVKAPL